MLSLPESNSNYWKIPYLFETIMPGLARSGGSLVAYPRDRGKGGPSVNENKLTALDWIGVVAAAFYNLKVILFAFTYLVSYEQMFADFSSLDTLPPLTALTLSPWFRVAILGLSLGLLLCGVVSWKGRPSLGMRRVFIVASFFVVFGGMELLEFSMQLPIRAMASAVSA